jgi:hypothetical protein
MSTVYVTQLPQKRDRDTGQLIPIFNINTAQEHGTIRVLMPAQAHFQPTESMLGQLRPQLADFSHANGDSLLLLGDSAIIAATVACVALHHDRFAVLRWDRILGRYVRIEVEA